MLCTLNFIFFYDFRSYQFLVLNLESLFFSFRYGRNQWNQRTHNVIVSVKPNTSIGGTVKPNEQLSPCSENPVALLVSSVLDSTNYHSWSRSLITTLSAKNKVEFVLAMCPCPPKNHPTYSTW